MAKKKTRYKQLIDKLDALCREYVRLRDNNTCQMTGRSGEYYKLDLSHVITRGNKRLRWFPDNCKMLHAQVHRHKWHGNPVEGVEWFKKKFPERWARIEEERAKGIKKWSILEMEELVAWFEKEIDKLKSETGFLPF